MIDLEALFETIDKLEDTELEQVRQYIEERSRRTQPPAPRKPGLHPGSIWTSDDFDEPLPDEFWTGGA